MNTNKETKAKTRIRHIYTSREAVIHNLFYRDEYSIYRASGRALTASYNYLFRGDHDSVDVMSKKELINDWNGNSYINQWKSETCEAVVNRDEHILVVSDKSSFSWLIIRSVPNSDWKVYTIDGKIDNPLIATKRYRIQLLKKAAAYLLRRCLYDISFRFKLAYTDKYYCGDSFVNDNPVYRFSDYRNDFYFKELVRFLRNNAIGDNSTIYKNRLINEFVIYGGNWTRTETFILRGNKIPTIKNLLNDNIFDAKYQNIVNMKMFYSKYCRGTALNYTWSQVKTLWNTRIRKYNNAIVDRIGNKELKDIVANCIKIGESHGKEPLWQDVLLSFYIEINCKITKLNYDNRKKSDEIRRKAIEDYYKTHNSGTITIKDWRDGKVSISHEGYTYIDVKVWQNATIRQDGYWFNDTIAIDNTRFVFPNTQLKLVKEEQAGVPKYKYYVETSRYCRVTLDDAIRLYHIFEKVKEMKKDKTNYFTYDFSNRNIKLGYYQLRSIKYCEKITDEHVSLHKDEWVVIVGCHHLWIDDFMDFVHYYHLEDKFGINKHSLPLKIQM